MDSTNKFDSTHFPPITITVAANEIFSLFSDKKEGRLGNTSIPMISVA